MFVYSVLLISKINKYALLKFFILHTFLDIKTGHPKRGGGK